jgi:hypothetical protein
LLLVLKFYPASGRSDQQGAYTFTDDAVLPNTTYYYRLRQVDFDGTESYSDIIFGAINDEGFGLSAFVPNPAEAVTQLTVHLKKDASTSVTLFDATGRQVFRQEQRLQAGNNPIEINVEHLPTGSYTARVRTASRVLTRKLIVR